MTTEEGRVPAATPAPRVLIVDDDQNVATHLAELLTDFDVTVAGSVSSGEAVLPAVQQTTVDVVIMDVRMPGAIDGLQAARLLAVHHPRVAVVLHTAYAGQLHDQAHQAGAVAEVAKGAHPQVLIDAVQRAYQTAHTAATAPPSDPPSHQDTAQGLAGLR